jgi:Ca-activated chloride channel homolog
MDLNALRAFHFLQPWWLLTLPPLWLLAAWFSWRRVRDGGWSQVIDSELLSALRLRSGDAGQSPWWLLTLIWTVAALALAGPAWQREQSATFRAPQNWLVVLDLSPSMLATDALPDRAARARYAITDLLNAARDARVGLVVFAGEAHVVTPLTSDVETVRALLPPLAPGIMPESGDQLAPALTEAKHLLDSARAQHAQVLLLTDGFVDPAQALQVAQQLKQQGAILHVVGVGTAAGAPEPDSKGGFVKDPQGRSVLSKLPVDQLQRVAAAGGGDYVPLSDVSALIASLQRTHAYQLEQNQTRTQLKVATWRNGGVWLLPPLLLLVSLLARRGWL